MKIPRDLSAENLIKLLTQYEYKPTRQSGSHIRLTTQLHGEHHLTLPKHSYLKIGTLNSVLNDIANHLKMDKQTLIAELFRR